MTDPAQARMDDLMADRLDDVAGLPTVAEQTPAERADYERGWQDAITAMTAGRDLNRTGLDVDVTGLVRRSATMLAEVAEHFVAIARDQERVAGRLALLDRDGLTQQIADSAWHSIWLHGDWRYLTMQMTTEEKEYVAAAVERDMAAAENYPEMTPQTRAELRWWR
jgi:hypothetical protein